MDKPIAAEVLDRLQRVHGIQCFIDDFLENAKPETVTKSITDALCKCSHLLGIITVNTRQSWWVPFEIGYAVSRERAITTFTNQKQSDLPEYLWDWPILTGSDAIDRFAALYKAEKPLLERYVAANTVNFSNTKMAADSFGTTQAFRPSEFHRILKFQLGQT